MIRRMLACTTVAAAMSVAPLSAQSGFGLIGGFVSSNVSVDPALGDVTWKSRSSIGGGISYSKHVAHSLDFSPELLYVQKGATASGFIGSVNITLAEKAGYVEAPLLLRYMFGLRGNSLISISAGPAISFKVSCTLEESGIPGEPASQDCNDPEDPTSSLKSTDVGLMFGVGFHMQRVSLHARYEAGMTNTAKDESSDASKVKNKAFFFLVGIALGK